MTIVDACNELGMGVYGGTDRMKFYCPFGEIWHVDGGMSKAFRIYENTNSAWCFACSAYYTPVKLIAADKDKTELEAAEWILEHTHYVAPDFVAQWDAITSATPSIDREALTEALRLSCTRFPGWDAKQFDDRIARTYTKVLSVLPKVADEDGARKWLDTAKQVMKRELERT